jgi:hypothetical protein
MSISITTPFQTFPDIDGRPLQNGYVWVGIKDLDPQSNPVAVYFDEALTIVATQPLRTKGGFLVNAGTPAQVFTADTYSIRVQNKNGALVYQDLSFSGGGGGGGSADSLDFLQAGTGAAVQSVQTKLRQYLAANDYAGVDPTGVTDSAAGLKAVFDYAIPRAIPVELNGNYLISGPIQPFATVANGSGLHIIVKGNSLITVNAASAGFADILYFQTAAYNSASITGAELAINGNNKAARGIGIRHNDGSGGDVLITAKLKIVNLLNTDPTSTRQNAAIDIYGQYGSVVINSAYIDTVNRTNPTVGGVGDYATAGISVGNTGGTIAIDQPYVANVLAGPGAAEDADGIKVFGLTPGVPTGVYQGSVVINSPKFLNCQGRSIKARAEFVQVLNPIYTRTAAVVAIPQGVECDFQTCADAVHLNAQYRYYGTDNVAPFSASSSFTCVAFQQTLTDRESIAKDAGASMITQVRMPRYALQNSAVGCQQSHAEVNGLKVIAFGSLSASCFSRAIMEFNAAGVAAKTERTKLVVTNVEAPIQTAYAITYGDYIAGDVSNKLSWEVTNCIGTIAGGSVNFGFGPIGGAAIGATDLFRFSGNYRFRDYAATGPFQNFTFAKLAPGTRFTVLLSLPLSIANAPAWQLANSAMVEVLSEFNGEESLKIRVTEHDGELGSQHWYTTNGGSSWTNTGLLPVRSAANIAAIGNAINATYKKNGLAVYDSTNNKVMVATGSAAASSWYGPSAAGAGVFPA